MTKEDIEYAMKNGYCTAMDTAFNLHDMYAMGFLHGMMFQKEGKVFKSKFTTLLEEVEKKISDENQRLSEDERSRRDLDEISRSSDQPISINEVLRI